MLGVCQNSEPFVTHMPFIIFCMSFVNTLVRDLPLHGHYHTHSMKMFSQRTNNFDSRRVGGGREAKPLIGHKQAREYHVHYLRTCTRVI